MSRVINWVNGVKDVPDIHVLKVYDISNFDIDIDMTQDQGYALTENMIFNIFESHVCTDYDDYDVVRASTIIGLPNKGPADIYVILYIRKHMTTLKEWIEINRGLFAKNDIIIATCEGSSLDDIFKFSNDWRNSKRIVINPFDETTPVLDDDSLYIVIKNEIDNRVIVHGVPCGIIHELTCKRLQRKQ